MTKSKAADLNTAGASNVINSSSEMGQLFKHAQEQEQERWRKLNEPNKRGSKCTKKPINVKRKERRKKKKQKKKNSKK